MVAAHWLLLAYAVAGALYWLLNAIAAVRTIRAVPRLEDLRPPDPPAWPKVSLIIPACHEAGALEPAVASRLHDDYPDLEVILIDDRSTDGTGAIIDRIAAADPRVKALHVTDLPAGWLGKVHALHRGTQAANGDWLLFSDADVHFAPGTIRRAVAYCLRRGLDHLAALPAVERGGFWLDVALASFIRLFFLAIRPWGVEDPDSSACIGIGAFNLVRRAAFERTEGFEWLKLEPGDDVALGMLLKRSGARSSLVNASDHLRVRWYGSLRQMAIGSERGGFAVLSRFRFGRAVAMGFGMLALELTPFLSLLAFGKPTVQVVGASAGAIALGTSAAMSAWAGGPILPALLVPAGSVILVSLVLRAGYLGWRRGGIIWRGTFYRTEQLRAGARVRFP